MYLIHSTRALPLKMQQNTNHRYTNVLICLDRPGLLNLAFPLNACLPCGWNFQLPNAHKCQTEHMLIAEAQHLLQFLRSTRRIKFPSSLGNGPERCRILRGGGGRTGACNLFFQIEHTSVSEDIPTYRSQTHNSRHFQIDFLETPRYEDCTQETTAISSQLACATT